MKTLMYEAKKMTHISVAAAIPFLLFDIVLGGRKKSGAKNTSTERFYKSVEQTNNEEI
jgi:hypothetical protein